MTDNVSEFPARPPLGPRFSEVSVSERNRKHSCYLQPQAEKVVEPLPLGVVPATELAVGYRTNVEELVRVDGAEVVGPKGRYGQGRTLTGHELDLEGVRGMNVYNSSHISLDQAEVGEGTPQHDRI